MTPGSGKKVSWLCDQCPDGHLHQWTAPVHRRSSGSGCPQCSGRKVCQHNSLATKATRVAAKCDYEANIGLGTPGTVAAKSHQPVQWRCQDCGHRWTQNLDQRVRMSAGCPQCAQQRMSGPRATHPTFADCQHPLLADWDHKRNEAANLFPHTTKLKCNKQIHWLCSKCPAGQEHSWSAAPYNRTGRLQSGCPVCSGHAACSCNSLEALYPATAAEWDYDRNPDLPSNYTASSNHLAWWCSSEGSSWQQTIYSRTVLVYSSLVRNQHIGKRAPAPQLPVTSISADL